MAGSFSAAKTFSRECGDPVLALDFHIALLPFGLYHLLV